MSMRSSLDSALRALILITILAAVAVIALRIGGAGQIFLIFVALGVTMVWAIKWQNRGRALSLQKAAASFGFQPADPSDVHLTVYPLRGGGWVGSAVGGEMRGLKAWIFDYTVRDQAPTDSAKDVSQTVAAFCAEDANLPIFQIRPLSTSTFEASKYYDGDWESSDDTICFPDALSFHRRFELTSSAEEAVRRHFNAQLLDAIANLNDRSCWVKGYYTTILFFTFGEILKPEELEAFARKGSDIAAVLFSSVERQAHFAQKRSNSK